MRGSLDKTHVALAYLLVVLGVSSRGGRAVGVVTSIGAFLSFNFFFLPPHYTLVVADPLNWAVLAAFLVTGVRMYAALHEGQVKQSNDGGRTWRALAWSA